MATKAKLFVILLSALMLSCGKSVDEKPVTLKPSDTSGYVKPNHWPLLKERVIKYRYAYEDSLAFDRVLDDIVAVASKRNGGNFKYAYDTIVDGDDYIKIKIESGFFFSKQRPNLIVRRSLGGYEYIDIFFKKSGQYHKVLSHEQWGMEYTGDTIRDVNGDGRNDFVVNWYGTSGCCLKGFSNVYLFRGDGEHFADDVEFISPTFSPNEHVIRGVCYGHPGETEMYKYRWNGTQIDTLEYISYESVVKNGKPFKTGKILISDKLPYGGSYKILKQLNKMPVEYTKIYGYDWFTGDAYD